MIVGDFVEDYEVMVPFQALQAVGHTVHAACPAKRAGQTVRIFFNDLDCYEIYTEKRGHNFTLNATFEDVDEHAYDALCIPGGRAPEYLRLNQRVIQVVRDFADQQKPIAAICHGPQILAAAKVINGRRISCYPAVAPEVLLAGATYADISIDDAVTDGNFVTAPAWPAHPKWIAQFLLALGTRVEHEALAAV